MAVQSSVALRLGRFALTALMRGKTFLGIGEVRFDGVKLRSPALPWLFHTESEKGTRFDRFENLRVKAAARSVTLHFQSVGEWLPRVQEADAMGDARIQTRRLKAPRIDLRWTFRLISEKVWDHVWDGLAMSLEIDSPGHPVHWVMEDTTWEIGGTATGCTLIQQDLSTIDLEKAVKKGSAFSTIEKFFTSGWGGAYPMDMLPRAAGAAICDFQTKGDLALCLFAEKPSLTRARLEKFADESVIHYTDRPFFPLTEKARPPERKLLVYRHPAPLRRHEWRNLWLDCFTEVRKRILKPFGFKVEIPIPTVHCHLWDDDLKKLGPKWTDPLRKVLPAWKKLGYRDVSTHGVWNSITSDPNPPEHGNICCPYEFRFAEFFGGNAGMKRLTGEAKKLGMDVYQWFSFHLSRHAKVWKQHPDWVLREANGDPWDANYNNLWAGRFRSKYGGWMERSIQQACRDAGLAGLFWDSYQNLGVTCIDWSAPDKSPQAEEIWRMQARLQKLGLKQRVEVTTIFGVSTVGLYGFSTDKFRRRLWADTVRNDDLFALFDTSPGFFSERNPFVAKLISPETYFRMAAHRALPHLSASPWKGSPPGGSLANAYARVNHLYNAALPLMKRLRLVKNGTHTVWLDDKNRPAVVWVFRKAKMPWSGPAQELGAATSQLCQGTLELKPGQVWLLQK